MVAYSRPLQQIINRLDGLTAADLRKLRAFIDYRLTPDSATPFADAEIEFWEALSTALLQVTGLRPGSLQAHCRRPEHRAAFSKAAEAAFSFLRFSSNVSLDKRSRVALLEICLRCLARKLAERFGVIDAHGLIANIESISPAVDEAFPGYSASGHLHRLVRYSRAESVG